MLKKAKQEIDYKDKYEDLQRAQNLKIVFASLGVLILLFATYMGVETSDVNIQDYHFKANVLHLAGLLLIGIPWIKNPFKK